jgi:hypothetical protein
MLTARLLTLVLLISKMKLLIRMISTLWLRLVYD